MKKYVVVESSSLCTLEELVNLKMRLGYKPSGSLVAFRKSHSYYAQAMILKEEPNDEISTSIT